LPGVRGNAVQPILCGIDLGRLQADGSEIGRGALTELFIITSIVLLPPLHPSLFRFFV
jgi:hypothetical protein